MKKYGIIFSLMLLIVLIITACGSTGSNSSDQGGGSGQLQADAGLDQTVMSVKEVTLDGSGSSGDIISYNWEQTSGTPVSINDKTAATTSFTSPGLTPGQSDSLEFTLTVTDGQTTVSDSVSVLVLTWSQVDTGLWHTIALRSDQTIWAWGNNGYGQIGQGNTDTSAYQDKITRVGSDSDWVAVSAGAYHNLALKSDGTVWAWGWGRYGQVGNGQSGTYNNVTVPTKVGSSNGWASIEAGEDQSFAIDTSGSLYGWGYNNLDRLGLGGGAPTNVTSPTQIASGSFTRADAVSGGGITALAIDGSTLWGWGNNAYGQLGVPANAGEGGYGNTNVPDSSMGLTDVVAVASGGRHTHILRNNVYGSGNDTLWSMGYNFNGELGTGDAATENYVPTEVTAPGVSSWKVVAAGANHCVAIASDGTLWSWGYNTYGQLGLGNSGVGTEKNTPQQVGNDTHWYAVSAWENHSAALKDDGTLWTWGRPNWGAIGDPNAPRDGNSVVSSPWRVGY